MKKNVPKFRSDKVMPRYFAFIALFVVISLAILGKATYIMFFQHDYWLTVSKVYESKILELPATRGNILSADGQVLATSLPEYRIYLDPMSWEPNPKRRAKEQHFRDSILTNCLDSIVDGMKKIIPELDTEAVRKRILNGRAKERHSISLHTRRVTYIQYTELKKLPLFRLAQNKGGFYVEEFRRRKNPYGRLAARTIGSLRADNDSALSGLELSFDSVLAGRPGAYHRQKVGARFIQQIDTLPENGCDVVTTLDVGFQDLMEKVLRRQLESIGATAGMCILMEVQTGDVKAISSLSRLTGGGFAEVDPRAVTNMMEPGSVFKPMSFMVAMDDGKITMNSTADTGCGVKEMHGRKMRDSNWRKGGDGVLTVPEIIKKSSNVGVSTLIDNAYMRNPDQFVDGLERIGITEDLHLPIPGYRVPRIRHRRDNPDRWYGTTLPWMSIGYETQIPPISTLTFYNGVANGGRLVRPRFVTAIKRGKEVVQEFPVVVVREKMCKPETLRNIQLCLEGVVGKNSGTGKIAYSRYFKVAGKTGTAQIWSKTGFSSNYLVSFAGYFPADAPRYSMIVCIEKTAPAYGGLHCCPVFRQIAESVMARELNSNYTAAIDSTEHRDALPDMLAGNLNALSYVLDEMRIPFTESASVREGLIWGQNTADRRNVALTPETKPTGVPSVVGYGLRDAVYRLERLGLKVRVKGYGCVVHQSVAAGSHLRRGTVVQLTLSPHPDDKAHEADTAESSDGATPVAAPAPTPLRTVSSAKTSAPKATPTPPKSDAAPKSSAAPTEKKAVKNVGESAASTTLSKKSAAQNPEPPDKKRTAPTDKAATLPKKTTQKAASPKS